MFWFGYIVRNYRIKEEREVTILWPSDRFEMLTRREMNVRVLSKRKTVLREERKKKEKKEKIEVRKTEFDAKITVLKTDMAQSFDYDTVWHKGM